MKPSQFGSRWRKEKGKWAKGKGNGR